MAWNPDTYNKFKEQRFAPFYDLLSLVSAKENMFVLDLGCGTGELTRKLADHLPGSSVLGIDSSEEMLHDSKAFENEQTKFVCRTIEEQVNNNDKWDLVFSNAAIQWVDDHQQLLPRMIGGINPGGQLAIQLPSQHQNISNKLLNELADEPVYRPGLQNWKRSSPVLETDEYAQILFENGGSDITVYEKIYPLILVDAGALFDWVSGTALIPYTERLTGETKENFVIDYKNKLRRYFPGSPVFYPFKRIIMAATF